MKMDENTRMKFYEIRDARCEMDEDTRWMRIRGYLMRMDGWTFLSDGINSIHHCVSIGRALPSQPQFRYFPPNNDIKRP